MYTSRMTEIEKIIDSLPKPDITMEEEKLPVISFSVKEGDDVAEVWDALTAQMKRADGSARFVLTFEKGEYKVKKPLCLDGGACLTVDGNGAVISGNRVLDPWRFRAVEGKPYFCYTFEPDEEGQFPDFHFLTVNGKMIRPACRGARRSCEKRQFITRQRRTYDQATGRDTNINSAPKMYLEEELFEGVTERDFEMMEMHLEAQWYFDIVHVVGINRSDLIPGANEIAAYIPEAEYRSMRAPCGNSEDFFQHKIYWLENCLTFLEKPGAFFYDRKRGKLYYYPEDGEDIRKSVIAFPIPEHLLILKNMKNTVIRNLGFTGADHKWLAGNGYFAGQAGSMADHTTLKPTAVYCENMDGFEMNGCKFHDVAGDALSLRGRLRRLNISANSFRNIGATAIRCGEFSKNLFTETENMTDVLIENNELDGVAWFLRESVALLVTNALNVWICHNTIRNCSYSAISIGTHYDMKCYQKDSVRLHLRNAVIAYNYISDFMTDMRDGAAIYTLGCNAEHEETAMFNYIMGNVIVWTDLCGDIHGEAHTSGLYNDNASSNWLDYGNIQFLNPNRQWHDMYFHYVQWDTWNIEIRDNVYVSCSSDKEEEQKTIIYHNVKRERNIREYGTRYLCGPEEMDEGMKKLAEYAGCRH